ncbi:MAG: phage terminase large subunit [Oscillospiraceae bacterium]|nr:phage terminase large subunit [Oscillospiraceae bacterium]
MTGTEQIHLYRPTPKQEQFLRDTHRHVAYGGARGGGKSEAARMKAVLLGLRWPGIRILIVRRTYQELINNHVPQLKAALGRVARYNKTEKEFTFANGSTIKLGYCAKDGDLDQYQGVEYDVIFIDEAGQLMEEWIRKINACVRGVNRFPKRTYYTLNPGGPSHAYFKRVFVDRDFRDPERPEDYSFIQAKVTDNLPLMTAQPEYIENLRMQPPHIRAMWLDGSWDIYAGQFFEELRNDPAHYEDRRWTHVIEPFGIPRGWNIYRSYDFGYNRPFSCGWWAVDYDGVLYRIMELYGCRKESKTGEDIPNEGV